MARQGGGLYFTNAIVEIIDTVFDGNDAYSDDTRFTGVGSAIYADPSDDTSVLDNVTFTNNAGVVIRKLGKIASCWALHSSKDRPCASAIDWMLFLAMSVSTQPGHNAFTMMP